VWAQAVTIEANHAAGDGSLCSASSFVQPPKQKAPAGCSAVQRAILLRQTEGEGLEPPWDCSRRISSAVPYQLGLALLLTVRR
jgi:hypothetical protein